MRKYFLLYINNSNKILKLTTSKISKYVLQIVIHNDRNNGEIHRSLKYCIQNFSEKYENIKSRYFLPRRKQI